ncbi:hypothetical protein [Mycetohabitans sp. B46]|uniref:hypothetical protein n=1 Tax=Mycetohabitans sp. B46 TaxID=2772536 RepID=UPI00307D5F43
MAPTFDQARRDFWHDLEPNVPVVPTCPSDTEHVLMALRIERMATVPSSAVPNRRSIPVFVLFSLLDNRLKPGQRVLDPFG